MARTSVVLQDQSTRLTGSKLMLVFAGLQLALFLSFLDSTSVSTAIPAIGRDLNASESITWVGTSFLVANTSFQIVTSRLSDIFGRKIVLLGSLALFVLGDLLCGFAQNAIWLYCCRAVAGIGGGGINSLCMIIMSDVVSLKDRGKYQGLLGVAISLGSAAGPFIGGLFAAKVTWRWTFWITPPMGVATMAIIYFLLPLTHVHGDIKSKLGQMDWLGTFLSLTMTVCALVPLAGGGSTFAWDSAVTISLFVVAGLAGAAFILVEARFAKLPLLPGRIFKNRNIVLILIQTFLVGMVFYGNIFYVPLYTQSALGYGAILSAALLLPLVLTQTFTTTISGLVVKHTGKCKSSLYVGFGLWTAGQAAQLCFDRATSKGVIIGVLFIQGMGAGATLQASLVLAQASGPSQDRAVVTGARNFVRTSGGAIAVAVSNTILNNVFAKNLPADIPAELRASLRREFLLPATLSDTVRNEILDAYMVGIKDVFYYFLPVVAICFLLTFLMKDVSLDEPVKPVDIDSSASVDEEKGMPTPESTPSQERTLTELEGEEKKDRG